MGARKGRKEESEGEGQYGGARTSKNRVKGRDKEGEQGLARIEKREGIRRGSKDYRE